MNLRPLVYSAALALCAHALPTHAQSSAAETAVEAGPSSGSAGPPMNNQRYTQLVLDGSYAASGKSTTGDGGGVALRLGRAIPMGLVTLVPEGVADFFAFSGTRTAQLYGASGGARLRFARGFEPGLFTHFGVAGVSRGEGYAAPTLDVGITADFTYFERLLLGFQGEYKNAFGVNDHAGFSWYTAGISVGTKL